MNIDHENEALVGLLSCCSWIPENTDSANILADGVYGEARMNKINYEI